MNNYKLLLIILTVSCFISCTDSENDDNANNQSLSCLGNDKTWHIEHDYMTGGIIVNQTLYGYYLDNVYWDNYVQTAYAKAKITLVFDDSDSDITEEIINTGIGDETAIRTALNAFVNQHNSIVNIWGYLAGIKGISADVFNGGQNAGFTYRGNNPKWSFVLVGFIINHTGSDYITNTKRLVVTHELGHMNGVAMLGHDAHGGEGTDCCVMHKPVPYNNCLSTEVVFCDDHACAMNPSFDYTNK